MKNFWSYIVSTLVIMSLGATYFSISAKAEEKVVPSIQQTAAIRFAVEAMREQGNAVLCGDPNSASSAINLNKMLSDFGRFYREEFKSEAFNNTSKTCLFLSAQ